MPYTENRIVAIIVTYNGTRWIERCLSSVLHSTVPVFPIIVDNGSKDGTVPFIMEKFPGTIIVESRCNVGFGRANNLGIIKSLEYKATHVLLINQDVYISPDLIELMLRFDDGNSLLSPVHLDGTGILLDRNFKEYTLIPALATNNLLDKLILSESFLPLLPAKFVNAACWFLPIELIKKVGGFNPLFFHYGEDNNYIHRLIYHRCNINIVVNSSIIHDRNIIGNKETFDKSVFYRMLLLIATDLNLGTITILKKLLYAFLRIVYYIVRFRIRECLILSVAFCKLLINLNAIIDARHSERKQGPTWL